MLVELNYEWMGNQPGAKLDLLPRVAQMLIGRGAASAVDDKEAKEKIPVASKDVGTAPVDKMVHQPENKKLFNRRNK